MLRSASHFGLTDDERDEAKQQLRDAILEAAYDRHMTTYGEIASQVPVAEIDPHSALISHLLGALFGDAQAAGEPALTAIVTHKQGDQEPATALIRWCDLSATPSTRPSSSGRRRFRKCSSVEASQHLSSQVVGDEVTRMVEEGTWP